MGRREEGRLTLKITCTNALYEVYAINYQVSSFCVNTYRETKYLLIGVDSFAVFVYRYCYNVDVRKLYQQESPR